MHSDLYVYRDEDGHAVAVARPHAGPNGGFSAHHIATMAVPSKRLSQCEIDDFSTLFVAAPDVLAASVALMAEMESLVGSYEFGTNKNIDALRRAILKAKAEGRS